jgi:hypothetical protein|tara:strand:+ start:718 stop:978 length:261 start_codon:yes stop_codon:yes gene_type:complete
MKTKSTLTIIALLITIASFGQQLKDINKKELVNNLNSPTKIWVNGFWESQKNGTKKWRKGYWIFEERSFQRKSELLKQKTTNRPKA